MLSRHRFCCYVCLLNALLLRECGLHILPTILFIILAYIDYFYRTMMDFESMNHGFESRKSHEFFIIIIIFFYVILFIYFFWSLLL